MASYSVLKKNTAQRIVFPLLDADGDPTGGATNLDSEYSIDGGNFSDCSDEAHNITSAAANTGIYYLDLIAGETNGDCICIQIKSTEAKTTVLVFYTASTTFDLMQTELNKIGTIVNSGGTATIGAVLGDFANSALVTRIGVGASQASTALSTATWTAGLATALGNYTALRAGYLDNINNAALASIALTGAFVNCQVKGQDNIDFGALQKASLNAATPAVTVSDKTGFSLSAAGIDSIWDEVMEGASPTARQAMRLFASALFAKTSGGGTATLIARDVGDTKDRIILTVDANGNRTAIAVDGA